jgi:hypothetical protein
MSESQNPSAVSFEIELEKLFPPSPEELEFRKIVDDLRPRLKRLIQKRHEGHGWMSAEEQIKWQDAARPRMIAAQSEMASPDGLWDDFFSYLFDDHEYLKGRKGIFIQDENGNLAPCDDPKIRSSVEMLEAEDRKVCDARARLAIRYSEGDPILERILWIHLEFNGGRIDPHPHEGILFFSVGRNASHQFSVGVKDGKCYVYSIGESSREGEWEEEVREVASDNWGYVGHF